MHHDHINDQSTGHPGSMLLRIVFHVFVGLLFAVVFALVFAVLVEFIWNTIMPAIFNLKSITFWQAFGMVVLAKLIFGGFGHHIHDRWKKDRSDYWHKKWYPSADEVSPPGKFSKEWENYRQYWQAEGKAAFEAYVDKIGDKKDGQ